MPLLPPVESVVPTVKFYESMRLQNHEDRLQLLAPRIKFYLKLFPNRRYKCAA